MCTIDRNYEMRSKSTLTGRCLAVCENGAVKTIHRRLNNWIGNRLIQIQCAGIFAAYLI